MVPTTDLFSPKLQNLLPCKTCLSTQLRALTPGRRQRWIRMQKVWVLLDSITEGSKTSLRVAPLRVSLTPFPRGEVLLSSVSLPPFLFFFPSVWNTQLRKCSVWLPCTQHPKALKCCSLQALSWDSQTCNPSTSAASTTANMSLEASKPADKTFNFLTWMLTGL